MEELNLGIGKFIYAKPCDTCQMAAASIFCRVDSLSLCLACDSTVHAPHARHERMWMCDVCEHAPAIVTCKADAAALCATCDRDIHSVNPLARRHERIPAVPFYDTVDVFAKTTLCGGDREGDKFPLSDINNCSHTSWTFPNMTTKVEPDLMEMKSVDFLFSEADQFLEFDCNATDSVVPVQTVKSYEKETAQHIMNQMSNKCLEIDFAKSKFNSFSHKPNFGTQSISQSISSSSMDAGVVPEGSAISDTSYSYIQTSGNTGSTGAIPCQGSDREARVMRYREKRKNRKFEKTIRYASRKAYAETRPRIKGRFAKRSEKETETNNIFISNTSIFMAEAGGYGVVPSY